MTQRINKLLVISPFYSRTFSGWAIFTRRLIMNLPRHSQCEVLLLTLNGEITDDSIEYKTININNFNSKKGKIIYSIKVLLFLLKNRKNFNSIFIPNLYLYSLILSLIKYFSNAKLIGRVCANEITYLESSPLKVKLLQNFDRLIVLNDRTLNKVIKAGIPANKVTMIANPVDTTFFTPEELDIKYQILFVGEITERKGLHILFEAYNLISKEFMNLKICIAGPITDERYEYRLQMKYSWRNNTNIIYRGKLAQSELKTLYNECYIFVLPSRKEGMPNVVLEAMSCGLPVIGSRIPGIIENITEEYNGFLFDDGDPVSLASSIKKALTNDNLHSLMKINARRFVSENRTTEAIYDEYSKIIF